MFLDLIGDGRRLMDLSRRIRVRICDDYVGFIAAQRLCCCPGILDLFYGCCLNISPEGRSGWWTDCGENLERVPNINSGLEFSVGTVRYEWNGVGPID